MHDGCSPQKASHIRITFPDGRPVLNIGPGDHTCEFWELTEEQCDDLELDLLNHRLAKRLGARR